MKLAHLSVIVLATLVPGCGGDELSNGSAPDFAAGAPSTDPGPTGTEALTCKLSGAASATTPSIWVIGDSTASVYASDLYPRTGWAQPLQDYFAPACATIRDRAISGRSSKSFFDEGAWTPVRDALKAGDYVLIQFGHNDEKADDPLRYTEPFTSFEQHLSIYIDDARARGATPVLLTPINRNNWTGTALRDTHGDYPVAMRQLAAARGVPLIDATSLTKTYFERLGQAATTLLFMDLAVGESPNYPAGNVDNTHLQERGARTIAELILADFARQALPIGHLVMTVPIAPRAAPPHVSLRGVYAERHGAASQGGTAPECARSAFERARGRESVRFRLRPWVRMCSVSQVFVW
jgi:lysophospholipase L1-like esterase